MKRFFIGISVLFLAIGYSPNSSTGTVMTAQEAASALLPPAQEELLGEISPTFKFDDPEYYHLLSVASPDRKQIAWAESKGAKPWKVFYNGQPLGPQLDSDDPPNFFFSEDSQHLLVKGWAPTKGFRSRPRVVLLDGKDQGTENGELYDAALSPDGKKFACISQNGILLVNGQKIAGPFEGVTGIPSLLFSADSNHLGCIVRYKAGKQHVVIIDGQENFIEDPTIDTLEFGASGRFELIVNRDDGWSYVVDGQEGPAFDILGRLVFSSDGKHYAYGGALDKHRKLTNRAIGTMVLNGKPGPEYRGATYDSLLNGFLGRRVSLIQGLIPLSSHYHGVSEPVFSKDGLHLAYAVRQDGGKTVVIRDGQPGPTFDEYCDDLAFSPDGSQLACVGRRAGKLVEVRDGIMTGELDTISRGSSGDGLTWLPDGQRTAFIALNPSTGVFSDNHYWAVVDGKPTKMYKCLGMSKPIFSSSGKHWACMVLNAVGGRRYRSFVIVDGLELKFYDEVIQGSLFFFDDETIIYVAREGHKYYCVIQRLS